MRMRAKLIRIGNSRGVRLPKALIALYELGDQIDLRPIPQGLVLRRAPSAREGWDRAFARMSKNGDDQLVDAREPIGTEWEFKEWTW